ncbi:TIGR00730 family Rossman fold protein [Desulfovibrio sulfodismutans]|uniref:Cytokinin riboside 5'-monophosphate phosphoribohydrolase n=1 Tax=Desulfolutivibrio sulfodismutans TaxID=63561 RepID=A0A7K3NGJ7_9BACT|nr:TIGR00730 family Rossman fold protein [Desulfolutivibrio sulfodismutans]NDY55316.1 TIGR00730 family Rossman fold protein [Desulfolutivibrio sulfodismutans]QLA11018.1 TIGR00730 family Rossman fold protein [Desulfolutivibrio sulfodismutans DSM 3696]
MKSVCVFCGSNPGGDPVFLETAKTLGAFLAHEGLTVVYGGASVGLMGATANACLAAGGKVIGVLPDFLKKKELEHTGLTQLHVVPSMHERKALMAELSDGFVALPGGMGTLEEFCEIVTWAQLGLHAKPCGLLNVGGFYDPLLALVRTMVENRFVRDAHAGIVLSAPTPETLLSAMRAYRPVTAPKWIDRDKS